MMDMPYLILSLALNNLKMIKKLFISNLCLFSLLLTGTLNNAFAQSNDVPNWVQLMHTQPLDLGAVSEAYNAYYRSHPFKKNTETQEYKRLLHAVRLDYDGTALGSPRTAATQQELDQYLLRCQSNALAKSASSAWSCIGPIDFDKESVQRSYAAGAAHVYTVEQAASNASILYAGTANAGLWKSIDKGQHWNGLTLFRDVAEVYALEINSLNPNTVYFGDGRKIWKTQDGGITFTATGDAAFQAATRKLNDLQQCPIDTNQLIAATEQGLFRTIDGGQNWTLLQSGRWLEVNWHTTNPAIVYAVMQSGVSTSFWKSTNQGVSFSANTSGTWPTPSVAGQENKRVEIAVTPAAPSIVYALATGVANGGSGLYGIYVSHDEGNTWSFQCCGAGPGGAPDANTNKNLCAWADDGSDDGGQYYYDLALAVSPFDSNEVHVGAVNHWVSQDGGVNFTCPSKWSHSYKVNYVHADIHDINFFGNDLWMACDGGVFYSSTSGDTIDRRMLGIAGSDFWGFATGWWDGTQVMAGGAYHNGTLLKDNNVYINDWLCMNGGDGTLGAVNYGNDRLIYTEWGQHKLSGNRMVNKTNMPMSLLPSSSYIVGEDGELEFDPNTYNGLYIAHDSAIWYSKDNGANFNLVHAFPNGKVTSLEIASDRKTIYAAVYPSWWGAKKLYVSQDTGSTWIDITPSSATMNAQLWAPFDMAVGDNPNEIWLVRTPQSSTYNNLNGYKVFYSSDAGTTWNNLTTPLLNNEYITNIVYQKGSNGGVYIGTRRAVYYRNKTMSDWALFNNNLPTITSSTQLVIDYKNRKIVNGTNRSVYVCDLYETNTPPVACISVDQLEHSCLRDTFYFFDHSALSANGATWNWSFPGGIPSSSTLRNPKVIYTSPGKKSVSLTVTDANGTSSQSLSKFISVDDQCRTDTIPGYALLLDGNSGKATLPAFNLNSNTVTLEAWIKPDQTQKDWGGLIFSRSSGSAAGISIRNNLEVRYHWNDNYWSWGSGLYMKANEWNHVVLVITPNSGTVYVNGIAKVNNGTHNAETFSSATMIGNDPNGGARYVAGKVDEVCIYNRALSQNEIREHMHLTRPAGVDPSLIAYYQMNEDGSDLLDKANGFHGTSSSGTSKVKSTAPLGGGNSARLNITNTGTYTFGNTGASLSWNSASPNGEVVATRINLRPDTLPNTLNSGRCYWVIDNYGSDTNARVQKVVLNNVGPIAAADAQNANSFSMYQRGSRADLFTWGSSVESADSASAGARGKLVFNNCNLASKGQLLVTSNNNSSFTSIEDLTNDENNIAIYPNIISKQDAVNINCPASAYSEIVIYDDQGRFFYRQSFGASTIITPKWKNGVYFYRVKTADKLSCGKIIVQE